MKSILSLNNKRKFGNEIKNNSLEYTKNSQENKINDMTCNSNCQKGKENKNKIKSKKTIKHQKKNKKVIDNYILEKEDFILDPQNLDEYQNDIIKLIVETESSNILNYSKEKIFELQDPFFIFEEKRKIIIELLFYYNSKWRLNPDSIYLAVNIIDRYTNKRKLQKEEYELVALAAFMIGSKYEDIYSPNAKCLSYIYNFKYEPELIIEKESQILGTLDYSLLYTSSHKILKTIFHISNIEDENVYYLSELFLEMSLTDLNIMKYTQRKRAIAAFLISKKFFKIRGTNYKIQFLFGYGENETRTVQKKMVNLMINVVISSKTNLIAEKFRTSKYGTVYTFFEQKVNEELEEKNINNFISKTEHKKNKW